MEVIGFGFFEFLLYRLKDLGNWALPVLMFFGYGAVFTCSMMARQGYFSILAVFAIYQLVATTKNICLYGLFYWVVPHDNALTRKQVKSIDWWRLVAVKTYLFPAGLPVVMYLGVRKAPVSAGVVFWLGCGQTVSCLLMIMLGYTAGTIIPEWVSGLLLSSLFLFSVIWMCKGVVLPNLFGYGLRLRDWKIDEWVENHLGVKKE